MTKMKKDTVSTTEMSKLLSMATPTFMNLIPTGVPITEDKRHVPKEVIRWYANHLANKTLQKERKSLIEQGYKKAKGEYNEKLKALKSKYDLEHQEKLLTLKREHELILKEGLADLTPPPPPSDLDQELIQKRIDKLNVDIRRLTARLYKEENILVPVDAVKDIIEAEYNIVRTTLLAIPTKMSPMLINKTDPDEIFGVAMSIIREALDELSDANDLQTRLPESTLPEIEETEDE